jgi:3-hydroxybutyrate dehydrogenase
MTFDTRLDGRVAIVTGAAGGLGGDICAMLRGQGAEVVPVDLAGEGVVAADAGSDQGARAMVEAALERHGRIDILVLNAGTQHVSSIDAYDEAEWDRLNNVMLKGPFLVVKHAWNELISRPGGRVVFTASSSSFTAEPFKVAYIAAKHGVLGLMRAVAVEGGPYDLTANAVAPGLMMTPLIERQLPEQIKARGVSREEIIDGWVAFNAIKRPVETHEVACAVAFLASPAASGITGATLPVELGELINAG